MNSIIKNLFIAVICVSSFAQDLFASSYFMGSIESVYSDRLLNVLRNPALIPSQKEPGSIGAAVKYQGYTKIDMTTDFDFASVTGENSDSSREKTIEGTAVISFSKRVGNTGFGIGLASSQDEQFILTEDRTELIYYDPGGNKISSDKREKITAYNPALLMSFGMKTGENTFAGLKLSLGTSLTKKEIREENEVNSALFSDKSLNIEFLSYSAELELGIFRREGNSETGLIIKSGAFSLSGAKLDYEYTDSASLVSSGSEKISFFRQMKKGPAVVAGSYIKVLPSLGIAVEGEYRLPAYYDDKSFDDNTYMEKTNRITISQSINIRGGCRITINPFITISTGGGFGFIDMDGTTENRGSILGKINGFFGMLGADLYLAKGFAIYTGVNVFKLNINYDLNETGMEAALKQDSISVSAFLGVSKLL